MSMFKGIQKVSLIDYPGKVACTLFTAGCNFRCPWCHNRELVLPELYEKKEEIKEDAIQTFLLSRRGKIQGVCITGGEPTLWGDRLAKFLKWCKENIFSTKLDTNGYLPEVLKSYINEGLLDYIAMDIKNVFSKYPETVGMETLDLEKIRSSIEIIKNSGLPHQFRTTLVPDLVDSEEMENFARELGEAIVFQEYQKIRRL